MILYVKITYKIAAISQQNSHKFSKVAEQKNKSQLYFYSLGMNYLKMKLRKQFQFTISLKRITYLGINSSKKAKKKKNPKNWYTKNYKTPEIN